MASAATPQQRRQFEKQKRDLQRKTQELNREQEKLRQANVALERDRRALETEKREWKNKKAKMKAEMNRPALSPVASPRRGASNGGGNNMNDRKLAKLQQELERMKREMGEKNQELRSLRTQVKTLSRDLRVAQKQLRGKSGKVQIVDHSHITKAEITRLKRDLKIARKKIHKLLDSIRVRKRYYGKHVNKFKRGENKYVRERAAMLKRDRVVVKYLFADRVNKVKLSRGKRNRVTLATDDGEVVLKPVQVVVVPEGGAGDIDDPEEILRELGDLDLDDEDMELPPDDDEDEDDEDDDEDAKVDDEELAAELEDMLNDPDFMNENGEDDDEDDPVYGADNANMPGSDEAGGLADDGGDGKEMEDEVKATDAADDTDDGDNPETIFPPPFSDQSSNNSTQGPYQVGDHVVLKDRSGIIRYIGPTPKSKGADMYGIELIDGSVGKHNGTVGGTTYFTCPDKRGIFVKEPAIRRKMRPKDLEKVEEQAAAIAQNEQRRHSKTDGGGGAAGKPNLMTFVIQESSRRTKDIDQLRNLLEEENPEAQNQGFFQLMTEYQERHGDFIAKLDSLSAQPDTDEFEDVRTYNSSFMNFTALLANTMAGKATLEHNSKVTLEYFLDELTGRIGDVHRLQDIHFNLDENPEGLSKEERCQALFELIVNRHQSEEDDLSKSIAENAAQTLEDFRTNNENWRGAMMRTKRNQDQLEALLREFAARTKAISEDIDGWKGLWQAPDPLPEEDAQEAVAEENADAGADANADEDADDMDAPPEDSGDDEA